MSEFCVINEAEELRDRLLKMLPQPMTYEMFDWFDDFECLLADAENGAVEMKEEADEEERLKEAAEVTASYWEDRYDDTLVKMNEAKDDYNQADMERREAQVALEAAKPDWRMTKDPFKEWYKEFIHAE